MNRDTLGAVQRAIARFEEAATAVERQCLHKKSGWPICGTKESGALRRASMDLTRALAELRRP